jgi:hypothetical protein
VHFFGYELVFAVKEYELELLACFVRHGGVAIIDDSLPAVQQWAFDRRDTMSA